MRNNSWMNTYVGDRVQANGCWVGVVGNVGALDDDGVGAIVPSAIGVIVGTES